MQLTHDIIHSWPKAELHSHLDGAMRLETMLEEADRQGKMDLLPAQTLEGLQKELEKVIMENEHLKEMHKIENEKHSIEIDNKNLQIRLLELEKQLLVKS